MDAKEQHGCQGPTWKPRNNMEAKEQHGGQGAAWSNMEGNNKEAGRDPPVCLGGSSELSYALSVSWITSVWPQSTPSPGIIRCN